MDPFTGHTALLEQLLAASSTLLTSQAAAAEAEAAILQQQAVASDAVAEQLGAEQEVERATGELAAKGPALMVRFKAAAGQLGNLTAATSQLLSSTRGSSSSSGGGGGEQHEGRASHTSGSRGTGGGAGSTNSKGKPSGSNEAGATSSSSTTEPASAAGGDDPGGQLLGELHSMLSELRVLSEQGSSAACDLAPLAAAAQQQYQRGVAALGTAGDLASLMSAEVALMPDSSLSHLMACSAEQWGKQELHWMSALLEQLEPMVTRLQQQVAELGQVSGAGRCRVDRGWPGTNAWLQQVIHSQRHHMMCDVLMQKV